MGRYDEKCEEPTNYMFPDFTAEIDIAEKCPRCKKLNEYPKDVILTDNDVIGEDRRYLIFKTEVKLKCLYCANEFNTDQEFNMLKEDIFKEDADEGIEDVTSEWCPPSWMKR